VGLHWSAYLFAASAATLVASALTRSVRLVRLGTLVLALSLAIYVALFAVVDLSLAPVVENSSRGLPIAYRIASSWSHSGGAPIISALILSAFAAMGIAGWRLSALLSAYLIAVAALLGAFDANSVAVDDGAGLNPLLKSPWVLIHPILSFAGYAAAIAAGAAAIARGRDDAAAFLAWLLVGLGMLLGAYWSYTTFGWGGYWAWDPVETVQLMVWLGATARLHAKLVDSSGALSRALSMLLAASAFLAMYVTRSGISPLHSFASESITAVAFLVPASALFAAGIVAAVGASVPRLTPLAIGAASLIYMFLVLLIIVLVPSITRLFGIGMTVPSGDEAVRLLHPVLYPATLIFAASWTHASASMLSRRLGTAVLVASTGIGSVLAGMALLGLFVWSPLSSNATNAAILLAVPLAIAMTATSIASVRRLGTASIIHAGIGLTLLGIVLSAPFAYNDGYFSVKQVAPGELSVVGGHSIQLINATMVAGGSVDIDAPYRSTPIYALANAAYESLRRATVPKPPQPFQELPRRVGLTRTFVADLSADGTTLRSTVTMFVESMHIIYDPRDGTTTIALRTTVAMSVNVPNASIILLRPVTPVRIGELTFTEAAILITRALGAEPTVTRGSNVTMVTDVYVAVLNGTYRGVRIPTRLNATGAAKLALISLSSDYGANLLAMLGARLAEPFSEALPSPVEESVYMVVKLSVDGAEVVAVPRFDVSGEVRGIRGLVPGVVTVPRPWMLGDTYMAVSPGMIRLGDVISNALVVRYVGHVAEKYGTDSAVAVSAYLAVAHAVTSGVTGLEAVRRITTELLRLSLIKGSLEEAVVVAVKDIPAVHLVWVGGAVTIIGGLTRLTSSLTRRGSASARR